MAFLTKYPFFFLVHACCKITVIKTQSNIQTDKLSDRTIKIDIHCCVATVGLQKNPLKLCLPEFTRVIETIDFRGHFVLINSLTLDAITHLTSGFQIEPYIHTMWLIWVHYLDPRSYPQGGIQIYPDPDLLHQIPSPIQ